ncbi:MAG: RIP metalloprotease RseP [Candidatus Omnitrophica bacterium]|nr:RIP metalloprotease RseP [Candidatus Omnitrophota bacterium]
MFGVLIFAFVLGVLIVVHEFGHFIVAKAMGVRVEKFSIGFGPKIYGKKFGETDFCVSLLPLGGFVKMAGESHQEAKGLPGEFDSKPLWQKTLVVLAGPFMNAFLAFMIFASVSMVGEPVLKSTIGRVLEDTPAKSAGLAPGDKILSVNGQKVERWDEVLAQVQKGEAGLLFSIDRDGLPLEFSILPRVVASRDASGKEARLTFVGIAPANEVLYLRHGFLESMGLGARRVMNLSGLILFSLKLMVTGAMPVKEAMTGPIGIYFMTQQAAQMGFAYLLYFMATLSVSLFVLNLLPIPVLDGGHLLFFVIERLKGSPIREAVKERVTQGGLVLLLGLMAFVILQDVQRFSILQNLMAVFKR